MNKNKFSKEVNDSQKYCDITQHTLLNKTNVYVTKHYYTIAHSNKKEINTLNMKREYKTSI